MNQKNEDVAGQASNNSLESNMSSPDVVKQIQDKDSKTYALNLDPNYWRYKFLYPFALDPAPLRLHEDTKQTPEEVVAEKKRQKLLAEEGLMETSRFQFPYS